MLVRNVAAGAGALASLLCTSAVAGSLSATDISGLDLALAGDHAVISTGPNSSIKINSGPITGTALFGQGTDFSASGGNNGQITGGLFSDNAADQTTLGSLENPSPFTLVAPSVTLQTQQDALDVANYASGLTADITYAGNIANTLFTSMGDLTVIDVQGDVDDIIGFSGGADDYFVVLVDGQVDTNSAMTLSGGVGASNILWVLEDTGGQCFKTAGGNQAYGTFLATNGCDYQFSSLQLTGALINIGGHIEHVSGSQTTYAPFTMPSPTPIPLPAPVMMLGAAVAGLGFMRKRKSKEA